MLGNHEIQHENQEMQHPENQNWILSFYRTSEISGALFFGRLSQSLRPGPIQCDMTRHFSDEAMHARYWTDCLAKLGLEPLRLDAAYQDQYISAAGMPANLMEVLALTQVFEKRVLRQYALHSTLPNLNPVVQETLHQIMNDEKWHIEWIHTALKQMEAEYGEDVIQATLARFTEADQQVYQKTMQEHAERLQGLF